MMHKCLFVIKCAHQINNKWDYIVPSSAEVIEKVTRVTKDINTQIQACNKHTNKSDKANFRFFETMAYMSQAEADKILANTDYSYLERILLCSKTIKQYQAGNCQLQTFVALDCLITDFFASDLSNYNQCIPISICTIKNHALIIVDDNLVCDPWSNYVGSIDQSPFNLANRKEIFGIRSNWDCFDNGRFDRFSTQFTEDLVKKLTNDLQLNIDMDAENNLSDKPAVENDALYDFDELLEAEYLRVYSK